MKTNTFSLKKPFFLISLALLSPGIFAAPAEETLNTDYKLSGLFSLDPKVLRLAKACHTLADPLDIHVQFGAMGTQGVKVSMVVYGDNTSKGYAVYTLPGNNTGGTDNTELNVPWGMQVRGGASLTISQDVTTPINDVAYDDPFCFSEQTGIHLIEDWRVSNGRIPIYENPPYSQGFGRSDYQKYCASHTEVDDKETTYWPDFHNPPDVVKEKLRASNSWQDYQGKYIFYRNQYPYDTGQTETRDEWISVQTEANSESSDEAFRYYFPISKDGTNQSLIRGGDFVMRLNNRNVTSLKLEISYNNGRTNYHFTWKREDGSYQSNDLVFQGVTKDGEVVSAGDIKDDPYQKFYIDGISTNAVTQGYFRGTLVDESSLNQDYQNYIKNVSPLSLPPKTRGNINLVSTDSLTFKIGDINGISKTVSPMVTVYGQPLKFGPLYGGKKLIATAMQVRNACY